jgi:hypothetical protein
MLLLTAFIEVAPTDRDGIRAAAGACVSSRRGAISGSFSWVG